MKIRESRTLDYIILSIALVNVSAASILVRLSSVHGFIASSWRLIIGSVLTIAILIIYRWGIYNIPSFKEIVYMGLSGVALALHFGLWMWSLQHLNVGPSVTIVDGYPALLLIIGTIFFGEKYYIREYIGIGLTFSGVALLSLESFINDVSPPGGDPLFGVILAILGMISVAIYFAIGKHIRSREIDTMVYTGYVYSIAATTSLVMVFSIGEPMVGYPLDTYIYLFLLGTIPMLGGHTLLNYLLKRMKLAAVAAPVITEPIISSILAYILFGEYLTPNIIFYMALSIMGITLVLMRGED
ncbi:TPA: DMT family transporter [Candidatus Geothermarchaeota archaeon]|nr:DMT family transporter [Candidatus Geothermarchaeota archaeon]